MSNSSLVTYTKISPNKTKFRKDPISRITIHCVVGQCTVESLGEVFAPTSRRASSNYGVGKDGRIGMYVEECDASWCSSSSNNDRKSITIECASDTKPPYAVTSAAYAALLDLCTDICERNGKKKLLWFGDKEKTLAYTPADDEMVLTIHRWFASTACPGEYLYSRQGEIAEEVTKRLSGSKEITEDKSEQEEIKPVSLAIGDTVTLASGAKYTNGKNVAGFVFKMKLYVRAINGDNITVSILKSGAITGVVSRKYIVKDGQPVVESEAQAAAVPYLVKVECTDLNIRSGADVSYKSKGYIQPGIYTIVEEKNGFGKLKSGAGWISLKYVTKM